MKKKLLSALIVAAAAATIAIPTAASAATVSPEGLNTCKVTYTYEYPKGYNAVACAFRPSDIACFKVRVKHVTCTQY